MIHSVVDILANDSGVQGAIGKDASNLGYRIYEVLAPQGTQLPFITVHLISATADDDKDGVSDLDILRVQISSFATTSKAAYDNYLLARTAVERYSGTNQSITIQSIRFITYQYLYEEDAKVHHVAADFNVRQVI